MRFKAIRDFQYFIFFY